MTQPTELDVRTPTAPDSGQVDGTSVSSVGSEDSTERFVDQICFVLEGGDDAGPVLQEVGRDTQTQLNDSRGQTKTVDPDNPEGLEYIVFDCVKPAADPVVESVPVAQDSVEATPAPTPAPKYREFHPKVFPKQLWRKRIAARSVALACRMQYTAAHTVMLRHREGFGESPIVDMNRTADAVLTSIWSSDRYGNPELALCFRLYRPKYDQKTNKVHYGFTNIVCKNGALEPRPRATGVTFDSVRQVWPPQHDRNSCNYRNFSELDGEIEAYTRNPNLVYSGPVFGDCLLGFTPDDFRDALPVGSLPSDHDVLKALEADACALLQPGAPPPSWLYSPGGTIVEIHKSSTTGEILIEFSGEEPVEIPRFASMSPDVQVGKMIEKGRPLAFINLDKPTEWLDAVKAFGLDSAQQLLRLVWVNSMVNFEGLRCIPHRYAIPELLPKHHSVLRDMRGCLGRVVHDPRNPETFRVSENEAVISVWSMYGPHDRRSLTFAGLGYDAAFHHMRPDWQWYFDPHSPEEWRQFEESGKSLPETEDADDPEDGGPGSGEEE